MLAVLGLVLAFLTALTPAAVAVQPVDEVHYTFASKHFRGVRLARGRATTIRYGTDAGYGRR